ncbi:phage tail tape measure protein [Solobacterium moorei]|uniref:Phage tail tape measure protein, TP901 family n=1 Tax=Solobacterium moorei F0204 TaxID=706433 RepID=E7MNY6_9FIRM|nr:phage tail tape measure protein [Solobacterium moorei]EFW24167.1 phage tail tape measure protein, TP901 family [Solobacterium moorei F0204]
MASGIELASAYVRLIPTTEGIGNAISEALGKETPKAGESAGRNTGKSFLGSFTNAMSGISQSLKPIGDEMTKSLTLPIAGLATASMAAWKQVDDGMDTVIQKTGATGQALEAMQNSVKNIATSLPVTFKDAGTAIGEVNTRFGVTGEQLEDISTKFLKFAKINGVDVNQSIDQVQKAISAFGLSTDDAGAFLDTLNKVGQDTGVSMDVLESGLISNSTALRGMGLNAASSATLLGNLEKSGVDVSTAMMGLKKVQANAMSEGISMQDAFAKALSSTEGAISVFGAKAGPQLYAAFENGALSADMFTDSSVSLEDALGSVSDTFDATLHPADQWQTVLNNLMQLGYEVAEAVMPSIQTAVDAIIPAIKDLADGWSNLDPGMQQAIIAGAGVLAILGPVISIISGITGSIGKLSSGISVLLGHPILLAIGAIIAGLVLLYQNNEDFRNFVNEAWKNIQKVVGGVIDAIAGFWTSTLQPTLQAIGDFAQNTLWPIIQVIFMAVGEVVQAVFSLIAGSWQNILLPAFTAIGTFLSNVLMPVFSTVFNGIVTVVSAVFSAISNFWNSVLKPVFTAIGDAAKWLIDAVKGPLSTIQDTFKNVFDGIKSFISPIVDWLKGIFDFNWKLPHIDLPHFSIEGEFSLLPPKVPHLSIDWYDRATKNPRILDGATIFGASGNTLLGGGETAREIIMSENYLKNLLTDGDNSLSKRSITINQNNYSPKELSPLETYRQLKRALLETI